MKHQSKARMIANPATPPTTPPAIAPVFEVEGLVDSSYSGSDVAVAVDVLDVVVKTVVDVAAAPSYIRTGLIPSKQDMNLTSRICRQKLVVGICRSIGIIYTPNRQLVTVIKPLCPRQTTEESVVPSVIEKIPAFISAVWWVDDILCTVFFIRTTHA